MPGDPIKANFQTLLSKRIENFVFLSDEKVLREEFEERRPGLTVGLAMASINLAALRPDWRVTIVVQNYRCIDTFERVFRFYGATSLPKIYTTSAIEQCARERGGLPSMDVCIVDGAGFAGNIVLTILERVCGKLVLCQTGAKKMANALK